MAATSDPVETGTELNVIGKNIYGMTITDAWTTLLRAPVPNFSLLTVSDLVAISRFLDEYRDDKLLFTGTRVLIGAFDTSHGECAFVLVRVKGQRLAHKEGESDDAYSYLVGDESVNSHFQDVGQHLTSEEHAILMEELQPFIEYYKSLQK
jgi:hypothetical protein